MSDKNDDSIIKEVESRLDYLFRENDETESLEFEENNIDSENYPLKKLRGIILSIDWEINDEIMTKFIEETNRLDIEYKDDKIIRMFLKLLVLIAKYIKKKKALAHPNAIKVFNSVFLHLDTIVSSKGITKREKKKILFEEINKFNKLKKQIAASKPAPAKEIEEETEEIEFMPEEDKFAPEAAAQEITAAFEEEETEEIEFMPEEDKFAPEAAAQEITAAFEEEETEEIEFMPEEDKFASEAAAQEMLDELAEKEPEKIELEPLEERPVPEVPAEEITLAFEEEEPEEIELIPLEEMPVPEVPAEEITLAFEEEEPEEIEFMDFEKKIEPEEALENTEPEVREEERGEISFVSEEKIADYEIPAIEEMAAEMVNKQEDTGNLSAHDAFTSALEELKEVIKAEFEELRAELKLWRENK